MQIIMAIGTPLFYMYTKITNNGVYCWYIKISRYVGINKNTCHMMVRQIQQLAAGIHQHTVI